MEVETAALVRRPARPVNCFYTLDSVVRVLCLLELMEKTGTSGGGYPVVNAIVEGSVAVRATGHRRGEQGGSEDGGVCQGCGEGARTADGGEGGAREGRVRSNNGVKGVSCMGHWALQASYTQGLEFLRTNTISITSPQFLYPDIHDHTICHPSGIN